jgi:hypothetical protein
MTITTQLISLCNICVNIYISIIYIYYELQEENMAISKNKKGDFLTSEDVSKMKYTNKVSMKQYILYIIIISFLEAVELFFFSVY